MLQYFNFNYIPYKCFNGIAKANIKADISEGFTLIEVNEKDKDKRLKSDILTKSFMLSVKGIEEENPEFIKLNITEE